MKIKEIKIINQDESTEVASIGADAINVDYNNTTVKAELDKLNSSNNSLINEQIDLQNQINELASGSPLVASSVSEMIDTSHIYVNISDGHWYWYNGSNWIDGGVYQATALQINSVDGENIKHHETLNPAILDNIQINKFCYEGVISNNNNWCCTDFIKVNHDDIIEINLARGVYLENFDDNKNYTTHQNTNNTSQSIQISYTIPNHTDYIRLNIYKQDLDNYILKINNQIYYGKYLIKWLSISEDNLSENLKDKINNLTIVSKWNNKNMIMFGDSLVSAQLDTENKDGYVGRLKDLLSLNQAENMGISGRPIANGTPNGVGTNTTINNVTSFSSYDLCLIAGGTNDFKLNVSLGDLGQIGDSNFNTNTFYGAYRDAIEHILSLKPSIKICIWTPLQRNNGGYNVNTVNTAGHKLIDYVEAIKKIGEMYSIPVIDLYSNSGITQLTLSTFTVDGLHLNGLGYDTVTSYASSFINNL